MTKSRRRTKRRKPDKVLVVQDGEGFLDTLRDVGKFIKRTKLISRGGRILGDAGVPYAGTVGRLGEVVGLGKQRKRRRRKAGQSRVIKV